MIDINKKSGKIYFYSMFIYIFMKCIQFKIKFSINFNS